MLSLFVGALSTYNLVFAQYTANIYSCSLAAVDLPDIHVLLPTATG
jgi:hypothetical protein